MSVIMLTGMLMNCLSGVDNYICKWQAIHLVFSGNSLLKFFITVF